MNFFGSKQNNYFVFEKNDNQDETKAQPDFTQTLK